MLVLKHSAFHRQQIEEREAKTHGERCEKELCRGRYERTPSEWDQRSIVPSGLVADCQHFSPCLGLQFLKMM